MSKKFRLSCLALAALLAAQTLTACGGDGGKTGDDTTPAVTTPAETTWAVHDDLGDLRYDDEEFTIYLAHGNPPGYYIMEEETGDVMDDAVYDRNRRVEERLGITLNYVNGGFGSDGTSQGNASTTINNFILAGDDTNDIYIHVQHGQMPGQIAQGNFVDWNTVENLDLTKEYWYQRCLTDINYGDKVMAMTGAYNLQSLTTLNVLFFNKTILDEAQTDYPYEMVLDGTWTIDKFMEYITIGTQDLNGDTKIEPGVDQTGYWGWQYEQFPAMFMGMGGDVCLKDAKTGEPVLNINNERTVKLISKMNEVFALEGSAYEGKVYAASNNAFASGLLLFNHLSLGGATTWRDMEDDFGFIPYPKLDEKQESYTCRVQNTSMLTYIPVTNNNLPFTGACLEVMASVSYNTTVPVFFDTVLTIKSTRDTESEQMIPIIRENAAFYDEAASGFSAQSAALSGNLASYWAGIEAKVTENVQKNIIDVYFAD